MPSPVTPFAPVCGCPEHDFGCAKLPYTKATMQKTTITISGNVTIESSSLGTRITSTHYNARHAQVYYAQRRLELAGWTVQPPKSGEGFRLPLKHPDEPMCQPLDAARPRARGFSATYGAAWLWLDASDGLPVKVDTGEPAEADQEALAVLREAGLIP